MGLELILILELIPKTCEVCVQSRNARKPFKSLVRCCELLGLTHSDICELNGILIEASKLYFITFIDD